MLINKYLTIVLIRIQLNTFVHSDQRPLEPVILIPGFWRNRLEMKLQRNDSTVANCQKNTSDFYTAWLNYTELLPNNIQCWSENMRLVYDHQTRFTRNIEGVQICSPGFGRTETLEWTAAGNSPFSGYLNILVAELVKHGYTRDVNIRGAPYDFRKGPHEQFSYFNQLKDLIEETFTINGNVSVVFIAHSLGVQIVQQFLYQQTKIWKSKYVSKLISVSGVWGGTVESLAIYATGSDYGVPYVNPKSSIPVFRSFPATAWLLPSEFYWREDEVLIETSSKQYTVNDIDTFLKDIGCPDCVYMRKDTEVYNSLMEPGVELHCIYSSGLPTINKLVYKSEVVETGSPIFKYGNGDKTVNQRSLEGCKRWQNTSSHPIHIVHISFVQHTSLIRHSTTLNYIINLLIN